MRHHTLAPAIARLGPRCPLLAGSWTLAAGLQFGYIARQLWFELTPLNFETRHHMRPLPTDRSVGPLRLLLLPA